MPKITSPLTTKTVSGPAYREVEIPDASGYSEAQEIDFITIDAHRMKRGLPPLEEHIKLEMLQQAGGSQKTFKSTIQEDEMTVEKLAEIEKKLQAAKQAKSNGTERLSIVAKGRIEALLGARTTRDVDIDEHKYTLRSLKGKEQREAIVVASEFDGTAHAAFEIRRQLLGRAIVSIDGTDLELYLGNNSLEAKLEFVELLEEPMLNKLYAEYLDMVQKTQDRYFIKTEQDAKEVAEDLKK